MNANRSLLSQAIELLEATTDASYAAPCEACFDSTLGGHMRHILEHYGNFLHGLDEGLVNYDRRDRARLKLILRGKRLGYSLDEIAEMIGMGNFDTDEEQQLKKAYSYGRRKLKEIESRMEELEILKQDLLRVQEKILNRLKQLNLKPPR